MEQSPPPPLLAPGTPSSSLGARLMNVFAMPGEVFEEIKARPISPANWLLPVALAALVGVVYITVVFSQETVLQQMREMQDRAMEKKLEKLPKEQREKVREMADKFRSPALMKIFGSVAAVGGSFAWLFFSAFLVWLIGTRFFKAEYAYMKAVEVCGLASMISVLGGIIAMLLVVIMGNMLMTPGPALLIPHFDAANKVHLLVSALNVMTFWYIGVLAVGLAKLSNVSWIKSFLWLLIPWAVFRSGLILSGFAQGM